MLRVGRWETARVPSQPPCTWPGVLPALPLLSHPTTDWGAPSQQTLSSRGPRLGSPGCGSGRCGAGELAGSDSLLSSVPAWLKGRQALWGLFQGADGPRRRGHPEGLTGSWEFNMWAQKHSHCSSYCRTSNGYTCGQAKSRSFRALYREETAQEQRASA